ncbi:PhzF family phenazine biosynthesis protein [Streptomyces sp. BA2]|uniref:PhzF family phenazine biosynthesis protein n=1 Tax=Streptomyces sp. BA2 TaxID=436595 RepID=UPI00132B29AE|nr:PhzF family phenazine biosynthesis protein [Streptomyces sp. BA2]MWA08148.1 PhzF family phenazine biosynthesis isomerase [Streptomyces sp. BA2]
MQIHVVDAFTDRPFAGNPAGVCLLDTEDWPEDAWMQRVAAEMNYSETAFARRLPDGDGADWEIRWFAPLVETNLCGHATLATAHTLRRERGLVGALRFRSRFSGILTAHAHEDGSITLDFPAAPCTESPVPAGLLEALGVKPEAVFRTGALGDLLTVLPDEAAVRAVAPDLDAMADVTRREGLRGVIITAPAPSPGLDYDFVSRFFSPAEGILEDPVTGSAHTALAPYWSERIGRNELTGLQLSARTGMVRTAVHGDRVHLTGHAVTILDGVLNV